MLKEILDPVVAVRQADKEASLASFGSQPINGWER
jgi:hypothetical protein